MLNLVFEKNISGLQKLIEFLGTDINNREQRELLQSALKEYRLWITMFLNYKDRITQIPTESRDVIISKVVETMKKCGTPKKWITAFYNEIKKHRWDGYAT